MVITLSKTWCTLIALTLLALVVSPYAFVVWKSESFKREILEEFKELRQLSPTPHAVHKPRYRKPSDMPQAIFPKAVVTRTSMDMPTDHVVYFLARKLNLSDDAQNTLSDIVIRYSNQRKILQGKIAVEVQLLAELSPSDADYMQKVSDAASIQADISTQVMRLYAEQQVEIYKLLTPTQIEELELIKHKFAQRMKVRIAKDRTKDIFSFESGDIESNEPKSSK